MLSTFPRRAGLIGKHAMSDEYLILFMELNPPEETIGVPEDHLHCALIVGPPKAKEVADAIGTALRRDVYFRRNAAPHFSISPAESDSPPIELRAQFAAEIKGYAGHEGHPDGDPHSRAVAYNQKARQLEDYVRSRKGLNAPCEQTDESPEHEEPPGEPAVPKEQPNEDKAKAIPKNLKDIPSLDKTNGEWVKQADAATDLQLDVQTLANDRLKALGGLKAEDGLCGIDRRGRKWRKERRSDQIIWYLKSSLSTNPT